MMTIQLGTSPQMIQPRSAAQAMPLNTVIDAVRTAGGERGEALFVAKIAEEVTPRELAEGDANLEARLDDALDLARGSLHLH